MGMKVLGFVGSEGSVMASRSVFTKSRVGSAVATLLALAGWAAPVEAAEPWPSQVQAVYRIQFNGFDVGAFEFNSSVAGQAYTLTGDAKLSALLGAFHWKGVTRSSGVLANDLPRPAAYTFDYAGTAKNGSIKMGFAGDSVANAPYSASESVSGTIECWYSRLPASVKTPMLSPGFDQMREIASLPIIAAMFVTRAPGMCLIDDSSTSSSFAPTAAGRNTRACSMLGSVKSCT